MKSIWTNIDYTNDLNPRTPMRGVWQTPGQFFSVCFRVWLNLVLIFYDFVAGTILRLPMKKAIGLPY